MAGLGYTTSSFDEGISLDEEHFLCSLPFFLLAPYVHANIAIR